MQRCVAIDIRLMGRVRLLGSLGFLGMGHLGRARGCAWLQMVVFGS